MDFRNQENPKIDQYYIKHNPISFYIQNIDKKRLNSIATNDKNVSRAYKYVIYKSDINLKVSYIFRANIKKKRNWNLHQQRLSTNNYYS